jgi:acetyl esterase/lipase
MQWLGSSATSATTSATAAATAAAASTAAAESPVQAAAAASAAAAAAAVAAETAAATAAAVGARQGLLLLGGHSSGAHLSAMYLLRRAAAPEQFSGHPEVSAFVGFSGVYDIHKVRRSAVGSFVHWRASVALLMCAELYY